MDDALKNKLDTRLADLNKRYKVASQMVDRGQQEMLRIEGEVRLIKDLLKPEEKSDTAAAPDTATPTT